jgi:hypothetical protein
MRQDRIINVFFHDRLVGTLAMKEKLHLNMQMNGLRMDFQ